MISIVEPISSIYGFNRSTKMWLDPLIALSAVTVNPAKTLDRNDDLNQVIKEAVCNLNILNSNFAGMGSPTRNLTNKTILEGNIICTKMNYIFVTKTFKI